MRRLLLFVVLAGGGAAATAPLGAAFAKDRSSGKATRALVDAVRRGDAEAVGERLAAGADPDARVDGVPAVEFAAASGAGPVALGLLINGATPTAGALAGAAAHGDGVLVDALLERGADPRDPRALHAAALGGHDLLVAVLLVNGAPASGRLSDGENALHAAARGGRLDTLRTLLRAGADPTDRGPDGTPEDTARVAGNRDAMQLLRNWATLGDRLWESAGSGDAAEVARLLDAGADPNSRHQGLGPHSALAYAADKGDDAVVGLLIERGADPDLRSDVGDTALLRAAARGHASTVRLLVAAGADVSWSAPNLGTAARVAERNGFVDLAEELDGNGP